MIQAAVWGAAGFIGSELCATADARGWSVHRLPRSGATSVTLADIDVAYHCAGRATETDPSGYVEAARNFARACSDAGVGRLVYLGTVAVYGAQRAGEFDPDSPLAGTGPYAESRIQAEHAMQAALAGSKTRLHVVRVPTVVGHGMTGTVIARFARAVGWGVFLHPGPAHATLACLGVRRMAQILVRIGELPSSPDVAQFADHLRWIDIARRVGELRGRRIVRIPLPALGGKFAAFAATTHYRDDVIALFGKDAGLPTTSEDLDTALKH